MDKAAAAAAAAAMTMAPPSGPAPRDIPIVHDGGRFKFVRDLGSGNFGVARLMRDTATGDLVAIKYIARGEAIDENVRREVVNHLQLRHPNIIRLNEVLLTPTHLGMVMEYAAGGELYARICNAGRFNEPEARYFFQQLISGVSYLHSMQICHRDLKLENALLDGSSTPWLKICDFGYSKSTILHSEPRTTVGTPVYIAPETVLRQVYDGKIADVWSCGVTLYVMLFGSYPFHDPQQPRDYRVTVQKVLQVLYEIPDNVHVSPECIDLLKRIFVAAPHCRITMAEIKSHPWYLLNLPIEMDEDTTRYQEPDQPMQKMDEVMQILAEATMLPPVEPRRMTQDFPDSLDMEEDMEYMYMDSDSESHSGSGSDSGSDMDADTRNRNSWEDVEAL